MLVVLQMYDGAWAIRLGEFVFAFVDCTKTMQWNRTSLENLLSKPVVAARVGNGYIMDERREAEKKEKLA